MSEHSQQHQYNQHQHQLSPNRLLAALPDSFLHIGSSTPQCHCQVRLLQHPFHQASPCTPSSSLLSFSDSSASFASEQSCATSSPQAAKLAEGRRRLRLMRREEGQLRELVTDLDSRLRLAGNLPGPGDNKDILALQRMSTENVLRTVQAYVATKSKELAAVAQSSRLEGAAPSRCKCDSLSSCDSDGSLLDC